MLLVVVAGIGAGGAVSEIAADHAEPAWVFCWVPAKRPALHALAAQQAAVLSDLDVMAPAACWMAVQIRHVHA